MLLWGFQVLFLSSYYEWRTTKNMKQIVSKLIISYRKNNDTDSFYESLENLSFENGICIELSNGKTNIPYTNDFLNRECIKGNHLQEYKDEFISSNQITQKYTTINPQFKNKTLIYGIKLDDSLYAFVSTSLVPINFTISILKSQFIYVTILVLILSLIVSYFISKKLSKPIEEITVSAKELAKGNYQKDFTTKTDIIEIEELTNTLNTTRKELAKTDELRRDLMANVSHDLKTPLTMIKAYAEMVRDLTYNDKEKRDSNLNIIIEETDRLALLVNDILTLSKLQQSMDNLTLSEFDLILLIKNILKRFTIYEEKYGYNIIFKHTNIRKLMIKADQKKIEQVLYNLIINAINYTGSDMTVVINISKVNTLYKIEIIDSGKGIDTKDLDNIFDKYYKSEKKHKRNLYGTGLGLSIVKSIFILHDYKYGVDTKKGKGSSFYFYISKVEN